MVEELKTAIEELYDKFSIYPLKQDVEGCPCSLDDCEKFKLHTTALRSLEGEDLNRYAASAIYTWGDENDFKHFMPRIFELLSEGKLLTDTFIVLNKLELTKWRDWSVIEQESMERFLLAWWSDLIQNNPNFDSEAFMEISKLFGSVQPVLDRWDILFNDNCFKVFIAFLYDEFYDIDSSNKLLTKKKVDAESIGKIKQWLFEQLDKVEQGFFRYEKSDKEFAGKVSVSYDILNGLKTEIT